MFEPLFMKGTMGLVAGEKLKGIFIGMPQKASCHINFSFWRGKIAGGNNCIGTNGKNIISSI